MLCCRFFHAPPSRNYLLQSPKFQKQRQFLFRQQLEFLRMPVYSERRFLHHNSHEDGHRSGLDHVVPQAKKRHRAMLREQSDCREERRTRKNRLLVGFGQRDQVYFLLKGYFYRETSRVTERVNGTATDAEMWTKTDFNQFHWAIRGKCQKLLVKQ